MDVAFTPHEALRWREGVCVVVDELPASSTIVALLDRGSAGILPVTGLVEGRRDNRERGHILAGEQNGLACQEGVELTDAAVAVRYVWNQYHDPLTALRVTTSGQLLNSRGLGARAGAQPIGTFRYG
jgi:hypothetical protein